MSLGFNRKQVLSQRSNLKKHMASISYKPEPAICHVILVSGLTWISNIKDVRCKPRLGISWSMAAMLRDVVAVVRHARQWSMPLAVMTMKTGLHGFLFLCMYVVLFLWVWCSACWPFLPPEPCYKVTLTAVLFCSIIVQLQFCLVLP